MNKSIVYIVLGVTTTVGAVVPMLFGLDDGSGLSVWSILGGLIGLIVGIWLSWQLAKRYG